MLSSKFVAKRDDGVFFYPQLIQQHDQLLPSQIWFAYTLSTIREYRTDYLRRHSVKVGGRSFFSLILEVFMTAAFFLRCMSGLGG